MDNRGRDHGRSGKFDFGFAVDWMRKDLGLVLDEAPAQRRASCRSRRWSTSSTADCRLPAAALGHLQPDRAAEVAARGRPAPTARSDPASGARAPARRRTLARRRSPRAPAR
jgi:hypothetical protein